MILLSHWYQWCICSIVNKRNEGANSDIYATVGLIYILLAFANITEAMKIALRKTRVECTLCTLHPRFVRHKCYFRKANLFPMITSTPSLSTKIDNLTFSSPNQTIFHKFYFNQFLIVFYKKTLFQEHIFFLFLKKRKPFNNLSIQ